MKKYLFVTFFFYVFLLSFNLFPAEKNDHHLILGIKIPGHVTVRKVSPHVPIDGLGYGGGIGFHAEVIPFPFIAFESGFYVRRFSLGGDVIYNEMQVPVVGKFRYPFSDTFALTIGGGITWCFPFSGQVVQTVGELDPVVIPDDDLTRALGFQAKIGFQILVANEVYVNIDIGVEHVGKVIEIKQTDLVFAIGLGYGLF
ncbi:MAG TPA: hypothetical protein ENI15_15975 [Spirochaetes bacterium]|nr:hypothetical protein [Spirochaetota bacterium]